jgi:hypothetical protein
MRAVRWLRFNNCKEGSLVKQSHSGARLLSVAVRWLTLLFRSQGGLGSYDFSIQTGYILLNILRLASFSPGKCWDITSNYDTTEAQSV